MADVSGLKGIKSYKELAEKIFKSDVDKTVGSRYNVRFICFGIQGIYIGLYLPVKEGSQKKVFGIKYAELSTECKKDWENLAAFVDRRNTNVLSNLEAIYIAGGSNNSKLIAEKVTAQVRNDYATETAGTTYRLCHVGEMNDRLPDSSGAIEIVYRNGGIPIGLKSLTQEANSAVCEFRLPSDVSKWKDTIAVYKYAGSGYLSVVRNTPIEERLRLYFNGSDETGSTSETSKASFFTEEEVRALIESGDVTAFEKKLKQYKSDNSMFKETDGLPLNIYLSTIYNCYKITKEKEAANVGEFCNQFKQLEHDANTRMTFVRMAVAMVGKTKLKAMIDEESETAKKVKEEIKGWIDVTTDIVSPIFEN